MQVTGLKGILRLALGGSLWASTLAGCGEYVAYNEDPTGQVAVRTPGAGDLDAATRARYAALTTLDHLLFEAILGRHVYGDGLQTAVDYPGLAADEEARLLLDQYLAILDLVDPAKLASTAERQAYWFNAYNAAVLRGVLEFWGDDPTWSVSEQAFLFFDQPIWSFGGVVLTLNQVEHGVLRGVFDHPSLNIADAPTRAAIRAAHTDVWGEEEPDPRLHVALNCASLSCPNLAGTTPRAFRAATLDTQLDALTAAFLASPTKGAGPRGISALFSWYRPDFDRHGYRGPEDFISRHRESGLAGVEAGSTLTYDWSLNLWTGE